VSVADVDTAAAGAAAAGGVGREVRVDTLASSASLDASSSVLSSFLLGPRDRLQMMEAEHAIFSEHAAAAAHEQEQRVRAQPKDEYREGPLVDIGVAAAVAGLSFASLPSPLVSSPLSLPLSQQ